MAYRSGSAFRFGFSLLVCCLLAACGDVVPGGAGEEFYNRIQPDIHYGDHVPGWINGDVFQVRETSQEVADDAETVIVYFPLS